MIPVSTYNAKSLAAFPDVCKTPSPGGPVPTPYPNFGAASTPAPMPKSTIKTSRLGFQPASFGKTTGDEAGVSKGAVLNQRMAPAQLRSQIQALHAQILALPGGNPNRWHQLLDEYVVAAAELYKAQLAG
jgi:hypothetical protein